MSLHYKIDILKIFHKGYNNELPALLSESIYTRRRNTFSLRGRDSLVVPRFETRYLKDSLAPVEALCSGTWLLLRNTILHI